MFDEILLPVDGSVASERATEHALMLAETYDATIHAFSVLDTSVIPELFASGSAEESAETELRETAQLALDSAAEACKDAGVPVTSTITDGHPTEEILKMSSHKEIDLIVLGSHARGHLARFLRSSIAEQVANESRIPVLIVQERAEGVESGYRQILLATDGGDSSRQAGAYAFDLAHTYGATVYGLYVVDTKFGSSDPIRGMLEQQGNETIREIRVEAVHAGVDLVTAVREGTPAHGILDIAGERNVDLIVLGTHGRAGVGRFVMGSVANSVLREAEQPVLIVPHKTIN